MTDIHKTGIFEGCFSSWDRSCSGGSFYNSKNQEYTIEIPGIRNYPDDEGYIFLYRKIKGNFILSADIEITGKEKAGWLIRTSSDKNNPFICVTGNKNKEVFFEYNVNKKENILKNITEFTPEVIQLERIENEFILKTAGNKKPFLVIGSVKLHTDDEVYVGLYVNSADSSTTTKTFFRNVRITKPAEKNFIPYTDYLGSRLEILDIESGNREIIYETPEGIEAPNWTNDGKKLIYNSRGKLFVFNINTKKIEQINTGFAVNNNNDHVLSPDGKILGISHHSKENKGLSVIYVLPVTGSDNPQQITVNGPSYLHGWSPDGKYMVFTGGRNNRYDIYKIALRSGAEICLTNNPGLDDGSEYSPDGKYIYFNSTRSGKMQIWRMKPDGTDQEQITDDKYNNWFPHISPDGKWIVFLSYGDDVKSDEHPYYKHVYIRLMPYPGGLPEIITYLYGGQGTLNVQSWSPDSKRIAFISNTGKI